MSKEGRALNFMYNMEHFAEQIYLVQRSAFKGTEIANKLQTAAANERGHIDILRGQMYLLRFTPSFFGFFFRFIAMVFGAITLLLGKSAILKIDIIIGQRAVRDYNNCLEKVSFDDKTVLQLNRILQDKENHIVIWKEMLSLVENEKKEAMAASRTEKVEARGSKECDTEKINIFDYRQNKVVQVDKIRLPRAEWVKHLTLEQYTVTTERGTEPPFSNTFETIKEPGVFQCVRCGTDLFSNNAKFDSGTGWPSYYEPVSDLNITLEIDRSMGEKRTEVLCSRCDSHLGHVFDDGPPPTGKRYCMNAVALKFVKDRE